MTATSPPVALVTGAAHGIGCAIAARLARDGFVVHAVDVDPAIAGTAARLAGTVQPHVADVADERTVDRLAAQVATAHGRLDALVANAGIMRRAPVTELALADWQQVLAVNLTSTFLLVRRLAPLLQTARGAVVTIASTRAHMSEPDTEAYAASKGGLVALSHALAVSLGPAIRVNCVSPGWIDTEGEPLELADHAQHPGGRVGVPDDVAALVAWLVGPESGFITGAEFVVDGGMTRKMIYV